MSTLPRLYISAINPQTGRACIQDIVTKQYISLEDAVSGLNVRQKQLHVFQEWLTDRNDLLQTEEQFVRNFLAEHARNPKSRPSIREQLAIARVDAYRADSLL